MLKGFLKSLVFLLVFCAGVQTIAFARDFLYRDKGRRDPFVSLVTTDGRILPGARSTSESGDIELEGIIWDEQGKSVAIINGKLLKEKERLMDIQVLKIKKASVILQKEGKVIVVNLIKGGGQGNVEKQ